MGTTARLSLTNLVAGSSTRANLISYWNANLAILDNALTTNAATAFQAGHGAGVITSNVAVGLDALTSNTTGSNNTAIGKSALALNTIGSDNTAVGFYALSINTTGTRNTALGLAAGSSITTGINVVCVGYDAQASSATTTNEIVLGDGNIARLRCQVTTITALSDERDKTNIEDLPLGLAFLRDVKPRRFNWQKRIRNEDGSLGERGEIGAVDFGFVAQELQAAAASHSAEWMELVFSMQDGEVLETTTGKLLPVAIKAIQELAATVDALTARIAALEPPA